MLEEAPGGGQPKDAGTGQRSINYSTTILHSVHTVAMITGSQSAAAGQEGCRQAIERSSNLKVIH